MKITHTLDGSSQGRNKPITKIELYQLKLHVNSDGLDQSIFSGRLGDWPTCYLLQVIQRLPGYCHRPQFEQFAGMQNEKPGLNIKNIRYIHGDILSLSDTKINMILSNVREFTPHGEPSMVDTCKKSQVKWIDEDRPVQRSCSPAYCAFTLLSERKYRSNEKRDGRILGKTH